MAQRNGGSGKSGGSGTARRTGEKKSSGQVKRTTVRKPANAEENPVRRRAVKEETVVRDPERESMRGDSSLKDEIAVICVLLFSVLLILSYFGICGSFGTIVNTVVFGLFGIIGYVFPFLLFAVTLIVLANKHNRSVIRKVLYFSGMIICVATLIELISGYNESLGFFDHFTNSALDYTGNMPAYGGLLGGMICFLLCPFMGKVATAIIMIVLAIIFFLLIAGRAIFTPLTKKGIEHHREHREQERIRREEMADEGYPEEGFFGRHGRRGRESGMSLEEAEKIVMEAHEKSLKKKGFIDMLLEEGAENGGNKTDNDNEVSQEHAEASDAYDNEIEFSSETDDDVVSRELKRKFSGRDNEDPSRITSAGSHIERGQILGRRGANRHCMVDDGFESSVGRLSDSREEEYTRSDFEEVGESASFLSETAGTTSFGESTHKTADSTQEVAPGTSDFESGTQESAPGSSDFENSTAEYGEDVQKSSDKADGSAQNATGAVSNPNAETQTSEPKIIPYVFPPISLLTKNKSAAKNG
ncbi:MAG: DNA translocase FtsK 4TM domain-containing protein, partial [Lachnospiraceae bacterium]|nr:DNA translocase FtsK 4TM domain-containing protein [Lachnospiraceae bacterium]